MDVTFTEDPALVLNRAGQFLASQPVLNNSILTILYARVVTPAPGRYWIATDGDKTVGVVIQSPLYFPAHLTPMEPHVIAAFVDSMAGAGVSPSTVRGNAATAAAFAGQWTERCKLPGRPFYASRLYELVELMPAPNTSGKLRQAGLDDRNLMVRWAIEFSAEIGAETGQSELKSDTESRIDTALSARALWIWDDDEIVSMAVSQRPVEGVVRVSNVYTPASKRRRGYAEACVHALSKHLLRLGYRCILNTELSNPTSNSIYHRIGYRAVAETLRYRFG